MFEPKLVPQEDEDAYRAHYLRADIVQVLVTIGVLGAASLFFMRDDLNLLGIDPRVITVFVNRLITAVVLTGASVALARATTGRAFDRALAALLIPIVVSTAHIFFVQPPNYIAHLPINLLLVTLLWFVMPGPIVVRGLAALALTLVAAQLSHAAELPPIASRSLGLAHGLTHMIGLPIAMRMARLRRDRFKAQLGEERIRKQLVAEKERAEALARAKTDFLATMSHEFRTPMNAVLGLSDVLLHSDLAPTHHEQVRTIHRSAEGLLVLLNDILEHAKLDAGRLTLEPTAIDIAALTHNAVIAVSRVADEKKLAITTTLAADIPRFIHADEARLQQLIVHLLSNAVTFTDHGRITVDVQQRDVREDKRTLVFRVTDTGIGISAENLERIFSAFERAIPQRLSQRAGTGLGLSISRSLAELMGGTLTVTSTVGEGSTFEFAFPTRIAEDPGTTKSLPMAPTQAIEPLRILIAEDNATNQDVIVAMLQRLGYGADIVENGQLAVEAAQKTSYDVILMDRHMPVVDGIDATRRIRELLGSKPYIVAVTAAAFAEDREACLNAGMNEFVAKPIRLDDLRKALGHAHTTHTSVNPPETPAESILAAFDPAPLGQLRELAELGEPDFLKNLCTEFLRDSEDHITSFPGLIARGDAETLKRVAHGMKAAAASVGAVGMSKTCAEIEKQSEPNTLTDCLPLVDRLKTEFDGAKAWLETELGKT